MPDTGMARQSGARAKKRSDATVRRGSTVRRRTSTGPSGWVPLIALFVFPPSPAVAASFDFSYVFGDGTTVEGVLDGDVSPTDPNLVENVEVTVVVVDGGAVSPFTVLSTPPDHDAVSFDGSQMDLQVEGLFLGLFAVLSFSPDGQAALVSQFGSTVDLILEPSRWELTPSGPSVPTLPGAMVFVLVGVILASSGRWLRGTGSAPRRENAQRMRSSTPGLASALAGPLNASSISEPPAARATRRQRAVAARPG